MPRYRIVCDNTKRETLRQGEREGSKEGGTLSHRLARALQSCREKRRRYGQAGFSTVVRSFMHVPSQTIASHPLGFTAAGDVESFRQAKVAVELARDLGVLGLGRSGKDS